MVVVRLHTRVVVAVTGLVAAMVPAGAIATVVVVVVSAGAIATVVVVVVSAGAIATVVSTVVTAVVSAFVVVGTIASIIIVVAAVVAIAAVVAGAIVAVIVVVTVVTAAVVVIGVFLARIEGAAYAVAARLRCALVATVVAVGVDSGVISVGLGVKNGYFCAGADGAAKGCCAGCGIDNEELTLVVINLGVLCPEELVGVVIPNSGLNVLKAVACSADRGAVAHHRSLFVQAISASVQVQTGTVC